MQAQYLNNYFQVITILPKETALEIMEKALPVNGFNRVLINARGTLFKDKWYQKLKPSLSPEQTIFELLVPGDLVDRVMDDISTAGDLDGNGTGVIYSMPCQQVLFLANQSEIFDYEVPLVENDIEYKTNVEIIYCIIQKDKAEAVAIAAIRSGAHGPTVAYGEGKGIREKLGLLRIAISPEKEIVRVVVDDYNSISVFEAMVNEGKLDTPGMGFIYTMPLKKALVNVASVATQKNELAHQYHIIKAIDELKGGTAWRTYGIGSGKIENKCLQNLVRLSCVINRGFSQPVIDAAMNAGAPGATTCSGIEEGRIELTEHGIHINKEVEIIELTMSPHIVEQVMQAMIAEIDASHTTAYIYTQHVNKALTYLE
jgi:nitrogen regulatory protein PII